jgi:hypothetical protein
MIPFGQKFEMSASSRGYQIPNEPPIAHRTPRLHRRLLRARRERPRARRAAEQRDEFASLDMGYHAIFQGHSRAMEER